MRQDNPGLGVYEYQTPATLNQSAPVNGTWYDILPPTENVRVYAIGLNIEDNDETLEVRAIIDGVTIPGFGLAATHSTQYWAYPTVNGVSRTETMNITATGPAVSHSFILEGRSVQIQLRKTTAAGVGRLTGIVTYGVKKN